MRGQRPTPLAGVTMLGVVFLLSLVWFSNKSSVGSPAYFVPQHAQPSSEDDLVLLASKSLREEVLLEDTVAPKLDADDALTGPENPEAVVGSDVETGSEEPDIENIGGEPGTDVFVPESEDSEPESENSHVESQSLDPEGGLSGNSETDDQEVMEENGGSPKDNDDGKISKKWKDSEKNVVRRNSNGVIIPTSKNYKLLTRDDISEILSQPAGVHGFQKKQGMLDPRQWMEKYKKERKSKVKNWLVHAVSTKNRYEPIQPPVQWPGCLVHVNHDYKFIWIKGKKVGGTSLRANLGWICKDWWKVPVGSDMSHCSEREYKNPKLWERDARNWWDDYFVFTIVRNPYSRFTSSFTYINKMMPHCPHQDFANVCRDPFAQAKTCGILRCCYDGAVEHHIHHMMEQSTCLFTENGKMAVDFVGHTESLTEDFQTIAKEINKRRKKGVPKLDVNALVNNANTNKKAKEDYGSSLFLKHPECLTQVQKSFAKDFERLGYEID